jgi:hypothetical protein
VNNTTLPFDFNTSKVEGHGPSFESEFGCKLVDREFTTTKSFNNNFKIISEEGDKILVISNKK